MTNHANSDANDRRSFWAALAMIVIVLATIFVLFIPFSGPWGGHHFYVSSVDFSPDGKTIAVGVYRWKPSPSGYNETPRYRMTDVEQTVAIVDATTGSKRSIVYQEAFSGRFTGVSPKPNSWAAYSRDGRRLVVGGWDGALTTYSLAQTSSDAKSVDTYGRVQSVEFSPDGKFLAVISRGVVELRHVTTLEEVSLFGGGMSPDSVSFSPDSRMLAVGDGVVHLVEVPSGREKGQFSWDRETGSMFLSLDGERFVVEESHGSSRYGPEPSDWVSYAPDGRTLAASSRKSGNTIGSARIIDLQSKTIPVKIHNVYGPVKFSPDGKSLVVGGYEGLHVFDPENGEKLQTMRSESVLAIDISPDGKTVISGDGTGRIQAWEIETGVMVWESFLRP